MKVPLLVLICLCVTLSAVIAETNDTNVTNSTNITNISNSSANGSALILSGYSKGILGKEEHAMPPSVLEGEKEMERLKAQDYAEEVQRFHDALDNLTIEKMRTMSESDREWYHTNALVYGLNDSAKIFESRNSLNAYVQSVSHPPETVNEKSVSLQDKIKSGLADFWIKLKAIFS